MLRTTREEGTPSGEGFREIAWDDEFGHAVIWEYDGDGHLVRRGVITHWAVDRWTAEARGEVIWHDADGNEIDRHTITSIDPLGT